VLSHLTGHLGNLPIFDTRSQLAHLEKIFRVMIDQNPCMTGGLLVGSTSRRPILAIIPFSCPAAWRRSLKTSWSNICGGGPAGEFATWRSSWIPSGSFSLVG